MSKQKFIKGMPIRNANRYLRLQLEESDVINGIPQDPENCAIAQCIKRNTKGNFVSINATRAYVEILENGRSVVEYYVVKGDARRYIEAFDKEENIRDKDGNIIIPLRRIFLEPPAPSECFDYEPPKKEIKYTSAAKASKPASPTPSMEYGPERTPQPKKEIRFLRNSTGKIRFDRD